MRRLRSFLSSSGPSKRRPPAEEADKGLDGTAALCPPPPARDSSGRCGSPPIESAPFDAATATAAAGRFIFHVTLCFWTEQSPRPPMRDGSVAAGKDAINIDERKQRPASSSTVRQCSLLLGDQRAFVCKNSY